MYLHSPWIIPSSSAQINLKMLVSILKNAGELLVCPPFGLQRVISLATLRVISLSTFLGAIFAL